MPSTPDVSPLEAHLGYWLRFVSNQVSHAFSLKLAALNVTVAEWVILRQLYEQSPAVPSELADRIGMTRGAISKLSDRLIAKSLIARAFSVQDRRYQTVSLTPAGRALVPELSALADKNDAEFFGDLAPIHRALIETLLKDIIHRHGLRTIPID